VHDWLRELWRGDNFPTLMTKRPRLRVDASLSILEKASSVAQLACPACKPLLGWSQLPVPVQPWSAQVDNEENQQMKQLVASYLANRNHFRSPQAGPLCVSVVTVLPRSRKRIDADNAVKGLLDSLANSVYENDRDIQCLTSRVMRNTNKSGHYLLRIAQVEPWEADVVWPNNPAPQGFA
jgi:Holliday junction resolvase RusA-like endonuclease